MRNIIFGSTWIFYIGIHHLNKPLTVYSNERKKYRQLNWIHYSLTWNIIENQHNKWLLYWKQQSKLLLNKMEKICAHRWKFVETINVNLINSFFFYHYVFKALTCHRTLHSLITLHQFKFAQVKWWFTYLMESYSRKIKPNNNNHCIQYCMLNEMECWTPFVYIFSRNDVIQIMSKVHFDWHCRSIERRIEEKFPPLKSTYKR